jgi:hypothetical protein
MALITSTPTTIPTTAPTQPVYGGNVNFFGGKQEYANAIMGKESAGQTLTDPDSAAAFKLANPDLFKPKQTAAGTIASQPNYTGQVAAPTVAPRTITEPETVSGQLNKLLSNESPFITSARNRGMEVANSRGLINSSLAAGTSERAAIDSALPIATSDAGTYANAGLSAQNANQNLTQTGYQTNLESALAKEKFGYDTSINNTNIQANKDLQSQRDLAESNRLSTQISATTGIEQAKLIEQKQELDQRIASDKAINDSNNSAALERTKSSDTAAIERTNISESGAKERNQATIAANAIADKLKDKAAYADSVTKIKQQTTIALQNIDSIPDLQMSPDDKAKAKADILDKQDDDIYAQGAIYSNPIGWTVERSQGGGRAASLIASAKAKADAEAAAIAANPPQQQSTSPNSSDGSYAA